jgi:phage-related protein
MARTQEEVEIVITARDEASKTMRGMSSAIGTALGTFAGGAALKGFEVLSGAIAGGIGDAREAALVFAQTQQVIKSTGGAAGFSAQQIADMAGSLSAASGKSLFGDDDIERGQNMLLTFTNIKETLPQTTQTMIDMAQALGTDAGGAAVQLGKALNDPINGISALTRVGVTFTDEQKAQIKTMQDAGDMAGAQGVILAELNKEFGGSAAAAAAADGGMAQLQDSMGELAESIGTALLPLIQQFIGWLNSPDIQAGITMLASGLVSAIQATIAAFGTLMAAMAPVVQFVKDNLTAVLAALAAMLLLVVVPAFVTWAAAAATAAAGTIAALAPVLLPIAAIGLAVGVLVTAWENDWGGMRTTLTAWWTGTVEPILTTVERWLRATLTDAMATLRSAWETAWPIIKSAVQTVYGYLSGTVWPWLQGALTNAAGWIQTLQDAWASAWGGISSAVSSAYSTISGIISTIQGLISGAIARINDLIRAINSIPGVNIPTIPGGQSLGGSGSSSGSSGFGGSSITINQTFGVGTAAGIRQQARLGATQGIRAAARAQGAI